MENNQTAKNANPAYLPALTLAYIGDAVYELAVRKHLIKTGIAKADQLHKAAIKYVSATAQADFIRSLEPELDETETGVFHRGRNAKGQHNPKNTPINIYKIATGLEALVGYWYLTEQSQRLDWFFARLWEYFSNRA